MRDFFEYTCDECGEPFCERISLMNLALDQIDEAYCLECLAEREGVPPEAFYHWILEYVMTRDCFKSPWDKFKVEPCPRIADQSCFCQVPA